VKRRGAQALVAALAAAGVRHLFSLSGNQILSIYDATIDSGIDILHTRHEAAAVHMADGWGRVTEAPGVALVTAGPGHLNTVSALYGALMAESPLVLLSGHAPRAQLGRGAFQEVDQAGAVRAVTKAAWVAERAEDLAADVTRALDIATSGRPGPVHVSLPNDLLDAPVDDHPTAASARTWGSAGAISGPPTSSALTEIAAALDAATRPLVLVGPAMARAPRWAAVRALADRTGIPALPMESPRGPNDPWLHLAAPLLAEADCVLLLGKRMDFALRFGEPPAFAATCRFYQVDWDADALATGPRVAGAWVGDPEATASRLAELAAAGRHTAWGDRVRAARAAEPADWAALRRSDRAPIHPLRVATDLAPLLGPGAVLVADGGEFGQWMQAGLQAETRLINGLGGSIGSALPMALAAKLARPRDTVLAVLGDGTFGFHALELDTAARHGLAVLAVVGNDARWNAEHQLQLQHYGPERTVGCELRPSRYDEVARALGAHGDHVARPADLAPALVRARASGLPACLNVEIEPVGAPTYGAAGRPAAH